MQFLTRRSNFLLPGTATFLILNRFSLSWKTNHMVCENWFMWSWSFKFQSSHPTCLKQNLSAPQEDGDSSLLWGWLEVRDQLLFSRGKSRVLLPPSHWLYLLLEPVSHFSQPELLLGFWFWWLKMYIKSKSACVSQCGSYFERNVVSKPSACFLQSIWAKTQLSDLAQFLMGWLCSE